MAKLNDGSRVYGALTVDGALSIGSLVSPLTLGNNKSIVMLNASGVADGLTTGFQLLKYTDNNIYFDNFDTSTSIIFRRSGPTETMRLDTNGYALVGYTTSQGAYKLQINSQIFATSATVATSDARYKQDVENITNALNTINALRPVSFNWKPHPVHNFDIENTTVGFLAQEVQEVLADKPYINSIIKKNECTIQPEIKDEEGNVIQEKIVEDFLGIAEGNLIAILTSAIQELSVKNDALEARIMSLEAKLST